MRSAFQRVFLEFSFRSNQTPNHLTTFFGSSTVPFGNSNVSFDTFLVFSM